jgi:hypothetical protein
VANAATFGSSSTLHHAGSRRGNTDCSGVWGRLTGVEVLSCGGVTPCRWVSIYRCLEG